MIGYSGRNSWWVSRTKRKGGENYGCEVSFASGSTLWARSRNAGSRAWSVWSKHANLVTSGRNLDESDQAQPGTLTLSRAVQDNFLDGTFLWPLRANCIALFINFTRKTVLVNPPIWPDANHSTEIYFFKLCNISTKYFIWRVGQRASFSPCKRRIGVCIRWA